ncbi:MAG: dephospho-CoA kinase [Flavobacteriales bacterium]
MLKIGITGGIGSGKTLICKVFEKLGMPVFYADYAGKEVLNWKETRVELEKYFGKEVFYDDQSVNKSKIAEIVFNNKDKMNVLNSIIHPKVQDLYENWLKTLTGAPYAIREAAIMIESGSYKDLDELILVTAPKDDRIKRIIERDKISKEEVISRMQNQLSDEEKRKYVDHEIVNDGKQMILPHILQIHQNFTDVSEYN